MYKVDGLQLNWNMGATIFFVGLAGGKHVNDYENEFPSMLREIKMTPKACHKF